MLISSRILATMWFFFFFVIFLASQGKCWYSTAHLPPSRSFTFYQSCYHQHHIDWGTDSVLEYHGKVCYIHSVFILLHNIKFYMCSSFKFQESRQHAWVNHPVFFMNMLLPMCEVLILYYPQQFVRYPQPLSLSSCNV